MTNIEFYDNDGKYVLDAYFDKSFLNYDMAMGQNLIPAEGTKINVNSRRDYDDEEDDVSYDGEAVFHGKKVSYMTFAKRRKKNLHYMI